MTTKNFTTLHVRDTIYSADSVEWCPIDPHLDIFACGTYYLVKGEEKDKQERIGSILLFQIKKEELIQIDHVDLPAVLDMKWCPRRIKSQILLGIANAIGEVSIFKFEENHLILLEKINLKKDEDETFLALSLDWSKNESDNNVCVSDSKGNITILKLTDANGLLIISEWNAHSLEAWIVCFDAFNNDVVYSGGDDGKLRVWSVNTQNQVAASSKHGAGVTAFHSNIFKEHLLGSGSYDEKIFLWDSRNFKSPIDIIDACGGIWRLKWEPRKRSQYLLSASIYGGFQIFDTQTCSIVADYREHESLAYGADWSFLSEEHVKDFFDSDKLSLIATCSFYDHKLCVSVWDESF